MEISRKRNRDMTDEFMDLTFGECEDQLWPEKLDTDDGFMVRYWPEKFVDISELSIDTFSIVMSKLDVKEIGRNRRVNIRNCEMIDTNEILIAMLWTKEHGRDYFVEKMILQNDYNFISDPNFEFEHIKANRKLPWA